MPFLRIALAAVVVADLLSLFFFMGDAREIALASGITLNDFAALLSQTAVSAVVVSIGVVGALAFARKPGRLWEGVLALVALGVLSTAHAQVFGSPWRHLFFSGLCLSGWLLGVAVSRHRGAPTDESYARMGSIALLGAAYLNGGISKIVYGGVDWLSGLPIQATIIGQDGLVADSITDMYRSWVVATPAVLGLFSVATVGLELAGPLMLAGRRTRRLVAVGLFAMHANIFVLTHILYWESMVLLLLFGLSPDGPSPPPAPGVTVSPPSYDRRFAAAAALLAACAAVAVVHQGHRFARQQSASAPAAEPSIADVPPSPAPPPSPDPTPLRRVGPFAVGQTVAAGWSIDALSVGDAGVVAMVSGTPGRVVFEVTCSASEHQSPFDLGAAHIFYSSDLQFSDFEAVGRALQAQLRDAAEGRDICERLVSWRMAAQVAEPRRTDR